MLHSSEEGLYRACRFCTGKGTKQGLQLAAVGRRQASAMPAAAIHEGRRQGGSKLRTGAGSRRTDTTSASCSARLRFVALEMGRWWRMNCVTTMRGALTMSLSSSPSSSTACE